MARARWDTLGITVFRDWAMLCIILSLGSNQPLAGPWRTIDHMLMAKRLEQNNRRVNQNKIGYSYDYRAAVPPVNAFQAQKQLDSDADYRAPPAPKRSRCEVEEEMFFQTSSAPTSPGRTPSPNNNGGENDEAKNKWAPLPDIPYTFEGLSADLIDVGRDWST
ncbi:hypothetical protein B0H19DRAFT_1083307 [Mycena capillaripes]|nr:hypothetical protein B0H19DRAFT_1083307 [Mycena capillaripes]